MERLKLKDFFVSCPHNFDKLTAKQFQDIFTRWNMELPPDERNYCELFEILTDLEIANKTPETEVAVSELLRWVVETPVPYSTQLPETVYLEGRTVTLPKKVGALSIGQNIMVRQALDGKKFVEEAIVLAAAIYIQPAFDGEQKFNAKRARELELVLLNYPAKLIYPIGFFIAALALKRGTQRLNFWRRMMERFHRKCSTVWLILRSRTAWSRTATTCFWVGIANFLAWTLIRHSMKLHWMALLVS